MLCHIDTYIYIYVYTIYYTYINKSIVYWSIQWMNCDCWLFTYQQNTLFFFIYFFTDTNTCTGSIDIIINRSINQSINDWNWNWLLLLLLLVLSVLSSFSFCLFILMIIYSILYWIQVWCGCESFEYKYFSLWVCSRMNHYAWTIISIFILNIHSYNSNRELYIYYTKFFPSKYIYIYIFGNYFYCLLLVDKYSFFLFI